MNDMQAFDDDELLFARTLDYKKLKFSPEVYQRVIGFVRDWWGRNNWSIQDLFGSQSMLSRASQYRILDGSQPLTPELAVALFSRVSALISPLKPVGMMWDLV